MSENTGSTPIPKTLLEKLYHEERLTQAEIGTRLGLPTHIVGRLMREYGIPRRTSQDYARVEIPRETLVELYYERGLGLEAIAAQYGVTHSTVARAMRDHGLTPREARSPGFITKQRSDYIALPKEELERLYCEEGWTLRQVAAHFGVTDGTVRHRMKEYGLRRRRRGGTRTLIIPREELYRLYVEEGLDGPTIAARYGCASSQIYKRLDEVGIERRERGWDKRKTAVAPTRLEWTAEFAYLIGLIASDGNLKTDGSEVKFTSTDRELIDIYCGLLGLRPDDVPPEEWPDPDAAEVHLLYTEKPYGNKSIYRIAFSDPTFRARLEQIGLTPNKSNTIGPLGIPDAYFPDFLRGEFDGDGSWYVASSRGRRYLRSNIVSGSPLFREWLFDTIHRLSPVSGGHLFHNALWFATRDSERLGSFMYYDANVPCLSRKRAIWTEWMER